MVQFKVCLLPLVIPLGLVVHLKKKKNILHFYSSVHWTMAGQQMLLGILLPTHPNVNNLGAPGKLLLKQHYSSGIDRLNPMECS